MSSSTYRPIKTPKGKTINVYDWARTMSYQTGRQAEIVMVCGGKGIGKTFGLRLFCTDEAIKKNVSFVEISRTKTERDDIEKGYFDKLTADGYLSEYLFKVEKHIGYYALKPADDENPIWHKLCYFVSLSTFQIEKRRTFADVKRVIFDEFIIDDNDRYHRYLNNEFFILANILDSILREQPNDGAYYKLYLLGNAVDLMNPYFRNLKINRVPKFGYQFFNNKTVLLHYVEPWDSEERQTNTLVGRMLSGSEEAKRVFDNKFNVSGEREIKQKTSASKYAFTIIFNKQRFAIWIDYKTGFVYVNERTPKDSKNIYTLTKKDSTVDYQAIDKNFSLLKMLIDIFYAGGLRYSSPAIRQSFHEVLGFLGVR